jgi:TPP-dependent pyruvate/acetoin dehydrogenase alpha subunit
LSQLSEVRREQLLRMFRDMLRIRMIEETIADRYAEQEMRCPVHLSIGQEASAVGVCHALLHTDRVFSTHRCHAHYLAMDGNLNAMLAEIYGKAAGCLGGRGGSMHLSDPAKGLIASVPIVASSIPLAVGTALSDQIDGNKNVSVTFFGDASVEEGVFHESANFASLRKLPVLFVCENNLYSVYTPLKERQPSRPLTELARAHGMNSMHADGNDVVAVFKAAHEAVERARRGDGPTFLLLDTYRWREHCGPEFDNHIGYRTEAEYEAWHIQCPIKKSREILQSQKILLPSGEDDMVAVFKREIDNAFEFAKKAPLPKPSSASDHVYA